MPTFLCAGLFRTGRARKVPYSLVPKKPRHAIAVSDVGCVWVRGCVQLASDRLCRAPWAVKPRRAWRACQGVEVQTRPAHTLRRVIVKGCRWAARVCWLARQRRSQARRLGGVLRARKTSPVGAKEAMPAGLTPPIYGRRVPGGAQAVAPLRRLPWCARVVFTEARQTLPGGGVVP